MTHCRRDLLRVRCRQSRSWYSIKSWYRELCPYYEEPLLVAFLVLWLFSFVCIFSLFLFAHCTALHAIDYVTRLLPAGSLQYIEVESCLGKSNLPHFYIMFVFDAFCHQFNKRIWMEGYTNTQC